MHSRSNGVGKSSFKYIDAGKFFSILGLQDDTVFLDLGCGSGNYSIAASDYIGDKGGIYAIDKSRENLTYLKKVIGDRGIQNICSIQADVSKRLPLKDHCVDSCLIAGVLHHLVHEDSYEATLKEVKRVLKHEGRLSIVEFKKIAGPPGPPIDSRISPGTLEDMLHPHGFQKHKTSEIGPYHYFTLFNYQK